MRTIFLVLLSCGLSRLSAQIPPASPQRIAELETTVAEDPGDERARGQLLQIYRMSSTEEAKLARRKHILWFIEHNPAALPLSFNGWIDAATAPADPEGRKLITAAWRKAVAKEDLEGEAYVNALPYLATEDPALGVTALRRALADRHLTKHGRSMAGRHASAILLGATSLYFGLTIKSADADRMQQPPAIETRAILSTSEDAEFLKTAIQTLLPASASLRTRGIEFASLDPFVTSVLAQWKKRAPDDPLPFWLEMELHHGNAMRERNKEKKAELARLAFAAGERGRALGGEPETTFAEKHVRAAMDAGELDKAVAYGRQVLETSRARSSTSGDVIYNMNSLLGLIALQRGNTAEALRHLEEAGKSNGSPALGSFGPDFSLARGLASAGEADAVIAHLESVRRFWKNDRGNLDRWIAALREGSTPSFNRFAGSDDARRQMVDRPAPPIAGLMTIDGAKWDLESLKGKIVLVDFWATWCAPCRKQMPELSAFYNAHKDDGFAMIGLSSEEEEDTVKRFLQKNPVSYPVAIAPPDLVKAYDAQSLPSAFWIDAKGIIVAVDIGAGPDTKGEFTRRWEEMRKGARAATVR